MTHDEAGKRRRGRPLGGVITRWTAKCPSWLCSWAVCLIAVCILLGAAYHYFVDPPNPLKLMGFHDHRYYFGPHLFYMDYALHQGEFPLWNSLNLCGLPFAANPQTAVFYPPNLVRSLLVGEPTPSHTLLSIALLTLAHLIAIGVGTFFLARDHKLGRAGSLAATAAYLLSAAVLRRAVAHWTMLAVVAWLPLLLMLLRRSLRTRSVSTRLAICAGMGLILGVSALGGFPEITVYVCVLLAAYSFLYRLFPEPPEEATARPRPLYRSLLVDTLFLGGVFAIGVLVSAAMVLPTTELVGFGARVKGGSMTDPVYAASLQDVFKGLILFSGSDIYQGLRGGSAATILLALGAVFHQRRRDVAPHALTFLIMLDIAIGASLGRPLLFSRLLGLVTPFVLGAPERALLVGTLPLALLAGYGVDALPVRAKTWRGRGLRCLAVAGATAAVVVPVYHWCNPHDYLKVTQWVVALPCLVGLVYALACVLPLARLGRALLVVGLSIELVTWSAVYLPRHLDISFYHEETMNIVRDMVPIDPEGAFGRDNRRGMTPIPNLDMYLLEPTINGYDTLYILPVKDILCSPWAKRAYLKKISGEVVTQDNYRAGLLFKRSFWLAREYVQGPLPPKRALFPPTTTAFLSTNEPLNVPRVAPEDVRASAVSADVTVVPVRPPDGKTYASCLQRLSESAFQFEIPVARRHPRHGVLRLEFRASADACIKPTFGLEGTKREEPGTWQTLTTDAAGRGTIDIPLPDAEGIRVILGIEMSAPNAAFAVTQVAVVSDNADEDDLIAIRSRSANVVELEVGPLPGHRILTFLDADYPGWTATVDGAPAPILSAAEAFKAVALAPGTHEVRFEFRPRRVYVGVTVSLVSAGGIVLCLIGYLAWRVFGGGGRAAQESPVSS